MALSPFSVFRFKTFVQSFQKWFACDDAHRFQSNIYVEKKKKNEQKINAIKIKFNDHFYRLIFGNNKVQKGKKK